MPNNMSKKIILIIGFVLSVTTWQLTTHSQEAQPSKHAKKCENGQCCVAYSEGMDALEADWSKNLKTLLDQERATSSMVDEAFESLRTYRCWAEYLCSSVLYSGLNSVENLRLVDGTFSSLTSDHIPQIPGCQDPEDIDLEDSWRTYIDLLKDIPILSEITNAFYNDKFSYLPQCTNSPNDPSGPAKAATNYTSCLDEVESRFVCDDEDSISECASKNLALVQITTALQKNSANQKGAALENKLLSILGKMQSMENHVAYLKVKLGILDQRYACSPPNCD